MASTAEKKYTAMNNNGARNYGSQSPPNEPMSVTYTVEEAIEALGFGKFQIKIIILGVLIWISDSMEVMILSIFSPIAKCEWNLKVWQEAFISTVVFIGMTLGSPFEGKVFDLYGRRPGLILLYFYLFFFGFLSAFSPSYGWILFLRGLVGFSLGGLAQTVTVVSELCTSDKRAAAITLIQCCWCVGSSLVVVAAVLIIPSLSWRWFVAVLSTPAFFLTILLYLFQPETPQFSLQIGNRHEAVNVLNQIARENRKSLPAGELVDSSYYSKEDRGSIFELFKTEYIRTTLLQILIWFLVFVIYYGVILFATQIVLHPEACYDKFEDINLSEGDCQCKRLTTDDYVKIIYTSLAEIPGSVASMILADEFGRKKTLSINCAIISILYLVMCSCPSRTGMTILLFIIRGLALGLTTILFLYTSEVYPTRVRGVSVGVCNAFGRVGAMVTPFIAEVLMEHSARMSMMAYSIAAVICLIAILLLPKEPPRPKSWIRNLFTKSKD